RDADWHYLGAPRSNAPGQTNFTPPFPAYTSGHATFGAATFRTLADFYGRDDITFSVTSDEFNGVTTDEDRSVRPVLTRTFHSLSAATEENGLSRIYLGIHWSFDKVNGIQAGNAIADYAFANLLRPRRPDSGDQALAAGTAALGPVSLPSMPDPMPASLGRILTSWPVTGPDTTLRENTLTDTANPPGDTLGPTAGGGLGIDANAVTQKRGMVLASLTGSDEGWWWSDGPNGQ